MKRILSCLLILIFSVPVFAQTETPPAPSAPRAVAIPVVSQTKLRNGLTVSTIERRNVPLVTVQVVFAAGAREEGSDSAGLANLTATMLTKGTRTRSATQLAEQIEFLGGSINAGTGWNNSTLTISVMADKLDAAMAILADATLNSSFSEKELKLLKSQTLDGLAYNLKQAGFLASYVSSSYSFDEHPAGGTPASIAGIQLAAVRGFSRNYFVPNKAAIVFAGDISPQRAGRLAQKFFGAWKPNRLDERATTDDGDAAAPTKVVKRILVVDLPDSGQASVGYNVNIYQGRTGSTETATNAANPQFYPAIVMNSVLGGGYSSRLNQEIRIKRGLSYGAGSSLGWRANKANFSARTQTKNVSAAQVAELIVKEIEKLRDSEVEASELAPRKLVLTGDFGRDLETTGGLAASLASLYTFGLPPSELNSHVANINLVDSARIKQYSRTFFLGGDIVIVGDYKVFKEDLAERFKGMRIEVVPASNYSDAK